MGGLIGLCALALLLGFVIADRLSLYLALSRLSFGSVPRLSYGGVLRHCEIMGGPLILLVLLCVLSLFFLLGLMTIDDIFLVLLCSLWVLMAGRIKALLRLRWRGLIIVFFFLFTPSFLWWSLAGLGVLFQFLVSIVRGTDYVPGIPAALLAPFFLGAGGLLIIRHEDWVGLLGLVMAGVLWALHQGHRFPPRWVLGPSGCVMVAGLSLFLSTRLFVLGDLWALCLLNLFMLADGACRLGAALLKPRLSHHKKRSEPAPLEPAPFEQARLRGEPERGLTRAVLTLSAAHLIVLISFYDQTFIIKSLVLSVLFLLALQFRLFLVRGASLMPQRPPWMETGAPSAIGAPSSLGRSRP